MEKNMMYISLPKTWFTFFRQLQAVGHQAVLSGSLNISSRPTWLSSLSTAKQDDSLPGALKVHRARAVYTDSCTWALLDHNDCSCFPGTAGWAPDDSWLMHQRQLKSCYGCSCPPLIWAAAALQHAQQWHIHCFVCKIRRYSKI